MPEIEMAATKADLMAVKPDTSLDEYDRMLNELNDAIEILRARIEPALGPDYSLPMETEAIPPNSAIRDRNRRLSSLIVSLQNITARIDL
jgi:hypothetical protein